MARHPNRQELSLWLDGEQPDLDDHIDSCETCAASLDEIDELAVPDLKPALLTLLQPPDDLHERVSQRIAQRLQNRRDADLFGSLLGIPLEAGRLFFDDADDDDPSGDEQNT